MAGPKIDSCGGNGTIKNVSELLATPAVANIRGGSPSQDNFTPASPSLFDAPRANPVQGTARWFSDSAPTISKEQATISRDFYDKEIDDHLRLRDKRSLSIPYHGNKIPFQITLKDKTFFLIIGLKQSEGKVTVEFLKGEFLKDPEKKLLTHLKPDQVTIENNEITIKVDSKSYKITYRPITQLTETFSLNREVEITDASEPTLFNRRFKFPPKILLSLTAESQADLEKAIQAHKSTYINVRLVGTILDIQRKFHLTNFLLGVSISENGDFEFTGHNPLQGSAISSGGEDSQAHPVAIQVFEGNLSFPYGVKEITLKPFFPSIHQNFFGWENQFSERPGDFNRELQSLHSVTFQYSDGTTFYIRRPNGVQPNQLVNILQSSPNQSTWRIPLEGISVERYSADGKLIETGKLIATLDHRWGYKPDNAIAEQVVNFTISPNNLKVEVDRKSSQSRPIELPLTELREGLPDFLPEYSLFTQLPSATLRLVEVKTDRLEIFELKIGEQLFSLGISRKNGLLKPFKAFVGQDRSKKKINFFETFSAETGGIFLNLPNGKRLLISSESFLAAERAAPGLIDQSQLLLVEPPSSPLKFPGLIVDEKISKDRIQQFSMRGPLALPAHNFGFSPHERHELPKNLLPSLFVPIRYGNGLEGAAVLRETIPRNPICTDRRAYTLELSRNLIIRIEVQRTANGYHLSEALGYPNPLHLDFASHPSWEEDFVIRDRASGLTFNIDPLYFAQLDGEELIRSIRPIVVRQELLSLRNLANSARSFQLISHQVNLTKKTATDIFRLSLLDGSSEIRFELNRKLDTKSYTSVSKRATLLRWINGRTVEENLNLTVDGKGILIALPAEAEGTIEGIQIDRQLLTDALKQKLVPLSTADEEDRPRQAILASDFGVHLQSVDLNPKSLNFKLPKTPPRSDSIPSFERSERYSKFAEWVDTIQANQFHLINPESPFGQWLATIGIQPNHLTHFTPETFSRLVYMNLRADSDLKLQLDHVADIINRLNDPLLRSQLPQLKLYLIYHYAEDSNPKERFDLIKTATLVTEFVVGSSLSAPSQEKEIRKIETLVNGVRKIAEEIRKSKKEDKEEDKEKDKK